MYRVFVPEVQSGTTELIIQYADNEKHFVALEIFLSYRDWCEIQEKPFYRDLIQYLDNLKIQGSILNQRGMGNSKEIGVCDT